VTRKMSTVGRSSLCERDMFPQRPLYSWFVVVAQAQCWFCSRRRGMALECNKDKYMSARPGRHHHGRLI